jgi:hypothetical protein
MTQSSDYPMTAGGGDATFAGEEGFLMRLWLVPPPPPCFGDCDLDGTVTATETARVAAIIAGLVAATACPLSDADADGDVDALDLGVALANASLGCP